MEKLLIIKISAKQIALVMFALCIILQNNSVYDMAVAHMGIIYILTIPVGLILILVNGKLSKNSLISCLLFLVYFAIFFAVNVMNSGYYKIYIEFVITFLLMYVYFCAETSDEKLNLFFCIENIMILIACVSLFFWLFGSVSGVIHPTGQLQIRWGKDMAISSYFGLYFEAQSEYYFGLPFYRNTGVFTEAPMFAINLLFAAMTELFMRPKTDKRKIILFSICMITTLSMSGLCFLGGAIFLKLYNFSVISVKKQLLSVMAVVIIFLVIRAVLPTIIDKINSSVSRQDDYIAGFYTWKTNILFGTGFGNNKALISNMSSFRLYNTGFSNSIMRMLAQSGIYLFCLYGYAIIKMLFFPICNKKNSVKIMVLLVVVYCTLLCTYTYNFLVYVALAYSMSKIKHHCIDVEGG